LGVVLEQLKTQEMTAQTYNINVKGFEHPLPDIMLSLVVSSRPVLLHQAKRLLWV